MFGVALASATSLITTAKLWARALKVRNDQECQSLRLKLGSRNGAVHDRGEQVASRPTQLARELSEVRQRPESIIAIVNDSLSTIDFETSRTQSEFASYARVAGMVGVAAGCLEVALHSATSTYLAVRDGLMAASAGLLGAVASAMLGRWAAKGAADRRQLWDEFVQRLLKSELPESAWHVRPPELNGNASAGTGNGQAT